MEKLNIQQAKAEISNMVRAFRAFEHAQNVLLALETAENRTAELVAGHADLEKTFAESKYRIDQSLIAAINDRDKAQEEADRLRNNALEKSNALVSTAQAEATTIGEKSKKALAVQKAAVERLEERAAELGMTVAAMEQKLRELQPILDRAERLQKALE